MKTTHDKRLARPFNPSLTWSPLDLIVLRNDCGVSIVRMQNAIDHVDDNKIPIKDSVRGNTIESIDTLRMSMIALADLESERNIANHNAMIEKSSHARTIGQLDEANKIIQQLNLDGSRLRASIEKLMKNGTQRL